MTGHRLGTRRPGTPNNLRRLPFRVLGVLFAAWIGVSGCSPQGVVLPEFSNTPPTRLLVLPPVGPHHTTERRLRLFEEALIDELRTKGYLVIEPVALREQCPASDSCELDPFFRPPYSVNGIVQATVDHETRNSFLIGYYNSAAGGLRLETPAGSLLYRAEHAVRYRGGLLFQSGQLLEGIKEQLAEARDPGFDMLLAELASGLVRRIPEGSASLPSRPLIHSTAVIPQGDSLEICLKGTPRQLGYFLIGDTRAGLREVRAGEYCRRFAKELLPASSDTFALLTLPFGYSTRAPITLPPRCSDEAPLTLSVSGTELTVRVDCPPAIKENGGPSADVPTGRIHLFRASRPTGPFTRMGSVEGGAFTIPLRCAGETDARLYVMREAPRGVFSAPVALDPPSGTSDPHGARDGAVCKIRTPRDTSEIAKH